MDDRRTAVKTLETGKKMVSTIMKGRYQLAHERQAAGRPVAWVMGSSEGGLNVFRYALNEILDIVTLYPENWAPLLASKGAANRFIESALSDGFSDCLCGYLKATLGYARQMSETGEIPPGTPAGGMAWPSVLVGRSENCEGGNKCFQALARYLDVPMYWIDNMGPHPTDINIDEFKEYYIPYLAQELRELVANLEKISGKKWDNDMFEEIMDRGIKTKHLCYEINELRKTISAPFGWEDSWHIMGPLFWYGGNEEVLEFAHKVYDEVKYRADNKIGVIPNEKYRLVWYGVGPWHSLRLCNYLESLGAVGVIESWEYYAPDPPAFLSDIKDPFERMAWWYFSQHIKDIPRAMKEAKHWRNQLFLDWVRDFTADGVFLHWVTTCRQTCIGSIQGKDVIMKYAKVPSLVVIGDMIDPAFFNEAEFNAQAQAFLDVMDHYKKIRQEEGLPVAHPI